MTTAIDLEKLQREAIKRLHDYIARIAGQQKRRRVESWRTAK